MKDCRQKKIVNRVKFSLLFEFIKNLQSLYLITTHAMSHGKNLIWRRYDFDYKQKIKFVIFFLTKLISNSQFFKDFSLTLRLVDYGIINQSWSAKNRHPQKKYIINSNLNFIHKFRLII